MAAIDLTSIERLQSVLGEELPSILTEIVDSMRESADGAQAGIAAEDLDATALAAHRCRNDALMVGARLLLGPLEQLELAARAGDLQRARGALTSVVDALPETLEELERVASS